MPQSGHLLPLRAAVILREMGSAMKYGRFSWRGRPIERRRRMSATAVAPTRRLVAVGSGTMAKSGANPEELKWESTFNPAMERLGPTGRSMGMVEDPAWPGISFVIKPLSCWTKNPRGIW